MTHTHTVVAHRVSDAKWFGGQWISVWSDPRDKIYTSVQAAAEEPQSALSSGKGESQFFPLEI